jgi:hypothetical protein
VLSSQARLAYSGQIKNPKENGQKVANYLIRLKTPGVLKKLAILSKYRPSSEHSFFRPYSALNLFF